MSLVLLCSCCRLDDIIHLHCREVQFLVDSMRMEIPKSKVDQYRKGHIKIMARSKDPALCPVCTLSAWMKRKEVGKGANDLVFPYGHKASKSTSKSSYRSALNCLQKSSGLPQLTPHRFRSGHISISIGNGSDPLTVMEVGNWSQAMSFQRYVQLDKEGKLQSSKALGL